MAIFDGSRGLIYQQSDLRGLFAVARRGQKKQHCWEHSFKNALVSYSFTAIIITECFPV